MISMSRRPLCQRINNPIRRLYSSSTIKEHDILYIRQQGTKQPKWHLTAPLRPDDNVKLGYGASVAASDLIGRRFLDVLHDNRGHRVVLHEPSLATYILLSDRIATPIYPHDANTIVSLLDLHLPRPGEDDGDDGGPSAPLEIFEAGTGMGSLTIHIARALHVANPPIPAALRRALVSAPYKSRDEQGCSSRLDLGPDDQAALDAYRASRRAVLHSLDRNPGHSRQAYRLVRRYRRAMYLPAVDFHLGSIAAFIGARLEESGGQPFLDRAVLDLPSAHDHAEPVIQALRHNALLLIFSPSISQIGEFNSWAEATGQPVKLEKVLELPNTSVSDGRHESGGGRPWDVKTFVPRAADQTEGTPVQIMRPKVGDRLAGGGFVAVLRRWPYREQSVLEEDAAGTELAAEEEISISENEDAAPEPRL